MRGDCSKIYKQSLFLILKSSCFCKSRKAMHSNSWHTVVSNELRCFWKDLLILHSVMAHTACTVQSVYVARLWWCQTGQTLKAVRNISNSSYIWFWVTFSPLHVKKSQCCQFLKMTSTWLHRSYEPQLRSQGGNNKNLFSFHS